MLKQIKNIKKITTFIAALLAAFAVSPLLASTPAQIQQLIEQGDCDHALTLLQKEQQAHPNQTSDILSALSVAAGLCSGRITADNADYAHNILNRIEQQNPMLTGLDMTAFQTLKAQVSALSEDAEGSIGTLLVFILLITFIGYWAFFRGNQKLSRAIDQEKSKANAEFLQRKTGLSDAVNKLYLEVDDRLTKARIGGHDAQVARLGKFLTNIEKIRQDVPNMLTLADLVAAETRLQNTAVLVKASG